MPITMRANLISLENTNKNEYFVNWEATVMVVGRCCAPGWHLFTSFILMLKKLSLQRPGRWPAAIMSLSGMGWCGWVWHLPLWPLELWLPVATSWLQKPAVHSSRRPQWNGRADIIAFMILFICIGKKEISICTCISIKLMTTNVKYLNASDFAF